MQTEKASTQITESERLAYSIGSAVKATDIGRTTIYQAIKEGKLRSIKKGDRRLILKEWLLEWLTEDA